MPKLDLSDLYPLNKESPPFPPARSSLWKIHSIFPTDLGEIEITYPSIIHVSEKDELKAYLDLMVARIMKRVVPAALECNNAAPLHLEQSPIPDQESQCQDQEPNQITTD